MNEAWINNIKGVDYPINDCVIDNPALPAFVVFQSADGLNVLICHWDSITPHWSYATSTSDIPKVFAMVKAA